MTIFNPSGFDPCEPSVLGVELAEPLVIIAVVPEDDARLLEDRLTQ